MPRARQAWNLTQIQNLKKDSESSSIESKPTTESPTSKNLCEALPNINNSACASTSRAESKESIDSKFLRIAFSRIFPRFSKSLVCAKRKGVYPLPVSFSPEKNKAPLFLLRFACNPLALLHSQKYIFWRESLAISLSSQKC